MNIKSNYINAIVLTWFIAIIIIGVAVLGEIPAKAKIETAALATNEYEEFVNSLPEPGKSYVKVYAPIAWQFSAIYDIPVSTILGISMHESDMGRSELCKSAYNFFGLNCMADECIKLNDSGNKKDFQIYTCPEESFEHFCQQFDSPRYEQMRVFNYAWDLQLRAMRKAGYAQDSKWDKKVSTLIEKYSLWRFDELKKGNRMYSITLNN